MPAALLMIGVWLLWKAATGWKGCVAASAISLIIVLAPQLPQLREAGLAPLLVVLLTLAVLTGMPIYAAITRWRSSPLCRR
ncbi:MAG: hypothetical protein JJE04_15205 [Acidobacteriia bacterium]|nr:hypothetical protein [Terriglobia bacterium]